MNGVATIEDVAAIEAQWPPADLPQSTYEMLARGAAINPDAPALSYFLRADSYKNAMTWSYRAFMERVTQAANFFAGLGVKADDVIAVVLPNLPETHFVYWGGEAAGIVATINALLEPAAIAQLIQATGAKVLVTLAPFPGTEIWKHVSAGLGELNSLEHLVLVDLATSAPEAMRPAMVEMAAAEEKRLYGEGGIAAAIPGHIRLHRLGEALDRQDGSALASPRVINASDRSSYFCTGGTTGLPKIAMRTHGSEIANAWSAGKFIANCAGPGKTLFCGLPMFHVNAMMVTGLVPLSRGAHVVLGTPQGYRADGLVRAFWGIVEHFKVNQFSAVPTLYAALLQVPVEGHDLSSLEFGMCGAAPLPVEIMRSFESKTGIKILEGYGLTEGACISTVNPPLGERRSGSIGLAVPGQTIKTVVLDAEGRYLRDCETDEVGIIAISGANLFEGYLVPEQNRGLWIDMNDGRRWLNTGDLGRKDAQGYLWLTGRKKELIIRGGHNIDPQLIEDPLQKHPAVLFAAAVGRPDAYAGELPVAYVQLRPDADVTEEELLEDLRGKIAERAAMPKFVRILNNMPVTGVGKIFKPALKRLETERAIGEYLAEAGIAAERITARDDKQRGLVVQLKLVPGTDAARVREVLGKFTVAFDIED